MTLPRIDGKAFGFLALCSSCQGSGVCRMTDASSMPIWARNLKSGAPRAAHAGAAASLPH